MQLSTADYEVIFKMKNLIYRFKRRLSKEDRLILKSHKLYPLVELNAIKIHIIKSVKIERAIKLASKITLDYIEWQHKKYQVEKQSYPSYNNLLKEFKARGFKKAPSLEAFLKEEKIPLKGGFIHSNRKIGGYYWVYPQRFAHGYSELCEGLVYVHHIFSLVGILGFTKITVYD